MKIFIGCSSSNEISEEYKVVTKYLADTLSTYNDLVFGCTNRGLMGVCYNSFLNNNRHITGICYEMYKDDLEGLKIDDLYMVKTLDESTKTLEDKSDIILFLPGSFGTLSELMYIVESKRTNIHDKDIIIFNVNGFYDDLLNMYYKIHDKVSENYDIKKLCKIYNTVDEVNNYIKEKSSN